jgi:hypothetical protein
VTKPTESQSDRSGTDGTGSSSEPTPVWDGAISGATGSGSGSGGGSAGRESGGSGHGSGVSGGDSAGSGRESADSSSGGVPAVAGGSGSSEEPARSSIAGGANGRADDAPPRLPPPWERVPAGGAEPAATARTGGDGPSGDRYGSGDGYGSTQRTGAQAATVTDEPERESSARRPVSPDLGEARTTEVDSRSIWTGQPSPPPGGFPAGWPRNRRPRQANLQLKRLDPWSVLKIALVLAVVLYLVWMVAVGVLYGALDGIGVWDRLNGQYADLVAEGAGDKLISAIRVFGVAAVVGAVNSLLVAVAFSVSAFIYNVSADLVGGIEVTLSERD